MLLTMENPLSESDYAMYINKDLYTGELRTRPYFLFSCRLLQDVTSKPWSRCVQQKREVALLRETI